MGNLGVGVYVYVGEGYVGVVGNDGGDFVLVVNFFRVIGLVYIWVICCSIMVKEWLGGLDVLVGKM